MYLQHHYNKQRGVTSLFIVIFSAMLLSVISLSFLGLMTREQQRSNDDELSRSAYDSAMAGVEDAKRVVALCNSGVANACGAIASDQCNTVAAAGVAGNPSEAEVLIQSSSATGTGENMNQAYTCVKIATNSKDYVTTLTEQQSEVIPLKTVAPVHSVLVEWQRPDDANGVTIWPTGTCRGSDFTSTSSLCTRADWGANPAIIRVQAITPGNEVNLGNITDDDVSGTAFLYPTRLAVGSNVSLNGRYVGDSETPTWVGENKPSIASCSSSLVAEFQCRATVQLPRDVPANNELSILRLTSLFQGGTTVRLTPQDNSGQPVDFNGVQPTVDSTGRANDVFRRVLARLSLASSFSYPENALELEGSLCKNFYVSTTGSGPVSISGAPVCNP